MRPVHPGVGTVIEPEPGDTVYLPGLSTIAVVEALPGEGWCVASVRDFFAASQLEDIVVPSIHAGRRWRRRVLDGEGSVRAAREDIADAWDRGVELEDGHGMDGDEVMFDPETGTVLVRRENAVSTIVTPGPGESRLKRAIEEAP